MFRRISQKKSYQTEQKTLQKQEWGGAQNHGLLRRVRETTLCFPEVDIVAMFTKFRNVR